MLAGDNALWARVVATYIKIKKKNIGDTNIRSDTGYFLIKLLFYYRNNYLCNMAKYLGVNFESSGSGFL